MNKPSLDLLMTKVDSRYSLVVAAAKRARAMTDNGEQAEKVIGKPVSVALKEIADDKIAYERTKVGIK
ncbi:MAG TPA: DNA-directed RNA polymerase subunit omega [Bacillota bacterium]|nr:DNA-directed RNA polymerase subunit omega [Bacillota bacterium]